MPLELDLDAARRLGAHLASAGASLRKAGFSERTVCAWFGAGLVSDVKWMRRPGPERSRRGLGAWIALLVAGEAVPRAALGNLVGASELAALVSVGLLGFDGPDVTAQASIVPVRGALVAADRLDDTSPEAVGSPDVSTWNLVASLPPGIPSLLDVGCGAGAASLVAALGGAQVLGTDVDPRALGFASVNSFLNDVAAAFLVGDLYAGVDATFAATCFNAPLVRAPLAATEATLFLRSPRGEALATDFFAGARAHTRAGGEVLCHVQLTDDVCNAAKDAGFPGVVEVHFADAIDGTPHGMISLRESARPYRLRARTPLGIALPHLSRELVDRLHATAELLSDDDALARAVLRPPPWLVLTHAATHDGAAFRAREIRFGAHRLTLDEARALEACDGRALGDLEPPGTDGFARLRGLAERALLVV